MGIPLSIILRYLLIAHHRLPLLNLVNKIVINGKKMYQLQVGYMLNPELNSTMSFKEQVEINMTKAFSGATIMPVIKVLQKGNTRVI